MIPNSGPAEPIAARSPRSKQENVNSILEFLHQLPKDLPRGRSDSEWTKLIKQRFSDLGRLNGCDICPEESSSQWLCDLVWYREENEAVVEVPLALESEWNPSWRSIRYDFEKLLAVKAGIKVMIFQDYEDNLPELWSKLEHGIGTFRRDEEAETYILAAFREVPHLFEIRVIPPTA